MTPPSPGAVLDFDGAGEPVPVPLAGAHVRVEPLDPAVHGRGLWAAASSGDPALWEFLPYGPFGDEPAFLAWLRGLAEEWPGVRFHAVVRDADDAPAGMIAFARIAPEIGRIEIAHVWFGVALQRTPGATEAVFLLAAHAFETLGYRRLEWKCDARNARSRRAAERFGFTYEGTFRQDLVVKGRNRDTAWFSLLDGEWPQAGAAFRAWLDPANRAADGTQVRRLAELRGDRAAPGSADA
jgi:RimJ/RimL family protein N-acetyltransferase